MRRSELGEDDDKNSPRANKNLLLVVVTVMADGWYDSLIWIQTYSPVPGTSVLS